MSDKNKYGETLGEFVEFSKLNNDVSKDIPMKLLVRFWVVRDYFEVQNYIINWSGVYMALNEDKQALTVRAQMERGVLTMVVHVEHSAIYLIKEENSKITTFKLNYEQIFYGNDSALYRFICDEMPRIEFEKKADFKKH